MLIGVSVPAFEVHININNFIIDELKNPNILDGKIVPLVLFCFIGLNTGVVSTVGGGDVLREKKNKKKTR